MSAPGWHCPHCFEAMEGWDPRSAGRCPGCRLGVGTGRAVGAVDGRRAGRAGSAAGMLRNRLARQGGAEVGHEAVIASIRRAAELAQVSLGDLRMVDYADVAEGDPGLVALEDLLATFGVWKQARAAALLSARSERDDIAL